MKCIRYKTEAKAGKIERVYDYVASREVSAGNAEYVSKKVWKEVVRDAPKSPPLEEKPKKRASRKSSKKMEKENENA